MNFDAGATLLTLLRVVGGLGIFLYGMQTMSEGIRRLSGGQLHELVQGLTETRLNGVMTGAGLTALIQSSSATTVVLVSMVNAGLISLSRSIPVIMGANIGTTFTAWIVSFLGFDLDITLFALPAVALSLPLRFSRRERRNDASLILLGFGLLFLGLKEMKLGITVLDDSAGIDVFLRTIVGRGPGAHLLFILIGAVLTVAVQSSSAAMTITLTLVYNGWIPFSLGAAIVLGENIGTTVTAFLASLEMSADAKRCARAHLLFNLIGVGWMLLLLRPVLALIDLAIPGSPAAGEAVLYHLSAFHTFFNLTNTLILIWFVPGIEAAVRRLVPDEDQSPAPGDSIPWIRGAIPEAREANLINARGAVCSLSARLTIMTDHVMNALDPVGVGEEKLSRLIRREEEQAEQSEERILAHLSDCALQPLTEEQSRRVAALMRIVGEFERIGHALIKIHELSGKRRGRKTGLHDDARGQLLDIAYPVRDFLSYIAGMLEGNIADAELEIARSMEEEINLFRNRLNKVSRRSIKAGASVKGELLFMELVRRFENIGDSCIVIAEELSHTQGT